MTISDLPNHLLCHYCRDKHYLTLNKDFNGNWSIGYVAYKTNEALLGLNNCSSLSEAATRMHYALERYNKASGQTVT